MVERIVSKKLFILILIITEIVSGAVFLAGGYFWGIESLTEKQKKYSNSGEQEQPKKTVNAVGSNVIKTIIVSGEASNINISGQRITLMDNGDSLDIYISENTQISSSSVIFDKKGKAVAKQEKSELSAIKIGDRISATLKIAPDRSFEAVLLSVVPLPNR